MGKGQQFGGKLHAHCTQAGFTFKQGRYFYTGEPEWEKEKRIEKGKKQYAVPASSGSLPTRRRWSTPSSRSSARRPARQRRSPTTPARRWRTRSRRRRRRNARIRRKKRRR